MDNFACPFIIYRKKKFAAGYALVARQTAKKNKMPMETDTFPLKCQN